MQQEQAFQYIKHEQIDSDKWNRCIENAINGRIYAYDWHLDRTAVTWDALVWGDYKYVMPLPVRTKFGLKYIFQPIYSQQLGIFPSPPEKVAEAFFRYILANYRYSDVQINSENVPVNGLDEIEFEARKNFLLPLMNRDYPSLYASFAKNTKRNISKANKHGLSLVEGIRLEAYLKFKAQNLQPNVRDKNLSILKNVIAFGLRKNFGKIYGAYTRENELCAAVYFCHWKDRVIYFNAVSNQTGKDLGGMYFLVDRFIEQNAGKNLVLDFEGSMIPGVARFFSGFGSQPETYFQLKFNRLPLFLKWFKR